jgi:hypothetical protein
MTSIRFGDVLEVSNGVWAIIALWLSVFLLYHLLTVRYQRKIIWGRFILGRMPLSMQIAVGVLVISVSIFVTRGIISWSRFKNGGNLDLQVTETGFYFAGVLMGIIGFLCVLRTVSNPTFGKWPWMAAIVSALVYISTWALRFF